MRLAILLLSLTSVAAAAEKVYPLSLHILGAESQQYVVRGNSVTTSSCSYGDCTTTTQRYDWPVVSNSMLARASDGRTYLIACEAKWRWSKCVQLMTGGPYRARWDGGRLAIEYTIENGKTKEAKYAVFANRMTE